jgi:hypothetical protein
MVQMGSWPDWVIVFFTAILSVVTALQYALQRSSGQETKIALDIARRSANAAERSALIAERALVGSQRPWLLIELSIVRITNGTDLITYALTITNHGNAPGSILNYSVKTIFAETNYVDNSIFSPDVERDKVYSTYNSMRPQSSEEDGTILAPEGSHIITFTDHFIDSRLIGEQERDIIVPLVCASIYYRAPTWERTQIAETSMVFHIANKTNGPSVITKESLIQRPLCLSLIVVDASSLSRIS